MKAVVQARYGGPDALEVRDVPVPAPGPGEVLVRVRAASLHPDVWHVVSGRPYVLRLLGAGVLRPKNSIPGTDMAGIVESVGSNVSGLAPGDAVFGETAASSWTHGGAFAEFVSVPAGWLAHKPGRITFEQAASVPTSGFITLLNLRDMSEWPAGKSVLIVGAGGGVGSLALQLAKANGAHVTAVDGPRKLDLMRSLGADEVLDSTREDGTRRGVRYDLIVDVPGHRPLSAFANALAPGGRYVPIGHEGYGALRKPALGLLPHFLGMMLRARFDSRLRGPERPLPGKSDVMACLREMLEAGKITPAIDSTWPLGQVREAFRHMVEDELLGKVVLIVST